MEERRVGPISQAPFGVDRRAGWALVRCMSKVGHSLTEERAPDCGNNGKPVSTKAEDLLNGARGRGVALRGFGLRLRIAIGRERSEEAR